MKALIGFIKKEYFHIIRDRRTLMILFGIPVIQLILFGYAIRNDVESVKVGIIAVSESSFITSIINRLEDSKHFKVIAISSDLDDVDRYFKRGDVDSWLVLRSDLEQKVIAGFQPEIQIILDASNANLSGIINQYLERSLSQTFSETISPTGIKPAEFIKIRYLFNPELESSWLFVPGLIAIILLLISALMTSITISREKEMGSMELLLASPLNPYQIIIGKVLPYFVLSIINVIVIIVISRALFGVPFVGNFMLFFGVSIIYVITALCLGILISSKTNSQLIAMMIAMVGLLLPTIILSGFIFPVKNLPEILQYISAIIPARWYLDVVRGIMLKGVDVSGFIKEITILLGMCLFLFLISVKSFKVRLNG